MVFMRSQVDSKKTKPPTAIHGMQKKKKGSVSNLEFSLNNTLSHNKKSKKLTQGPLT